MKRVLGTLLCAALLAGLCSCASLLNRQYSVLTPQTDAFWEDEDDSTLRAENYQELVNVILILISARAQSGQVRLYGYEDLATAESDVSRACREVQVETALGSYALNYLTFTCNEGKDFYEAELLLRYRRTAEEMAAVVKASSTSALDDLLRAVAALGGSSLTVQVSYADTTRDQIRAMVADVQWGGAPPDGGDWPVNFYPASGPIQIVEILLESSPLAPPIAQDPLLPGEDPALSGEPSPTGETPGGETTTGETPSGETPSGETPTGDAPTGETPNGETPNGEPPTGEPPGGDAPTGDAPSGETPNGEAPNGEAPNADSPNSEILQ